MASPSSSRTGQTPSCSGSRISSRPPTPGSASWPTTVSPRCSGWWSPRSWRGCCAVPHETPGERHPRAATTAARGRMRSMTAERFEVQREIAAPPAKVFALLCDPRGHVAIDSSGMLQSAEGSPVRQVGDTFVVHMDREALNDYPMGKYDVTVIITRFEQDACIEWTISGTVQPPLKRSE